MQRITTVDELRQVVGTARAADDRIGLVPTMGALHEGHLSLVRRAAEVADFTVVSIFVNPTQFDDEEDLATYPRELEGDEGKLRALGAAAPEVVFAPPENEIYPVEPLTTVHVDRLTARLCGVSRPGHFDGVCTVVTKLVNIARPDVAVFGRKDFQQLAVLRRMVSDLNLGVEIAAGPTVREPDGVAMSSRNHHLDADQREAARVLPRSLRAGVLQARSARDQGRRPDPQQLSETVLEWLEAEPEAEIDYVEIVDPDSLLPPASERSEAPEVREGPSGRRRLLIAVAAGFGPARLIDNVLVGDLDDEDRLLEATEGMAERRG